MAEPFRINWTEKAEHLDPDGATDAADDLRGTEDREMEQGVGTHLDTSQAGLSAVSTPTQRQNTAHVWTLPRFY